MQQETIAKTEKSWKNDSLNELLYYLTLNGMKLSRI